MTVRELEPCLAHMLSLLSRHKFDKWLSSARTSRSKYLTTLNCWINSTGVELGISYILATFK